MLKKVAGTSAIAGAIISCVIALEGGYVNDPGDPGGPTKYGITEQVARSAGYKGNMQDLTLDQANAIYQKLYVEDPNFSVFISIAPAIAHKLIDSGINVGTVRVSLWLQRALNQFSLNGQQYQRIEEDGVIGSRTINAYNSLVSARGASTACKLILKSLDAQQTSYYLSLPSYDPKFNRFLIGWIDKRISNIPLDQCDKYNLSVPLKVSTNDSN